MYVMGSKEILKSDTKISTENDKDRKNLSIILAFPVSSSASSIFCFIFCVSLYEINLCSSLPLFC